MRRINKYPLEMTDRQTLDLPRGAEILDCQEQQGTLQLWALVESHPDHPRQTRTFRVVETGHAIPDSAQLHFIATVQTNDGLLEWHVFEETVPVHSLSPSD